MKYRRILGPKTRWLEYLPSLRKTVKFIMTHLQAFREHLPCAGISQALL